MFRLRFSFQWLVDLSVACTSVLFQRHWAFIREYDIMECVTGTCGGSRRYGFVLFTTKVCVRSSMVFGIETIWSNVSLYRIDFTFVTNLLRFASKRLVSKRLCIETTVNLPHSPILYSAYSPLIEENNSAKNRLPLGLFALFSRSWISLRANVSTQICFPPTFIFCSPICSNNCGVVFL